MCEHAHIYSNTHTHIFIPISQLSTLLIGLAAQKLSNVKKVKVLAAQLCLTLCDPMDCSPPGSSVHGILQARILEWVDIPFSRGSPWPMRTWVSALQEDSLPSKPLGKPPILAYYQVIYLLCLLLIVCSPPPSSRSSMRSRRAWTINISVSWYIPTVPGPWVGIMSACELS